MLKQDNESSPGNQTMNRLDELLTRLDLLHDIGISLSSERQLDRLLDNIVEAARAITRADGGTLYLLSEDRQRLRYELVRTASLGITLGGGSAQPINADFPDLPLYQPDGSANHAIVAAHAALSGQTVNIADAYTTPDFDFTGPRAFDARMGYRSRSFLTVPMKNHENALIGVLQLVNAIDPENGQVTVFQAADQRLVESLASQAAIALSNRQLMQQMEALFEATIRMINTAIARKSPFTNSHCERVPELTMLIAEAVCADTEGPLAAWKLDDESRNELRIAALMHDCGKITTPVHVIDKARKLETIFDRIALIDMRFETIRRDARIRALEALSRGEAAASVAAREQEEMAQIAADQAFLHHANRGSERMRAEDVERVHEIARKYLWTDGNGEQRPFLDDDEVENLTIVAGTLTAAERQVINDHIVATIQMLDELPWPRHLANVPEIAGNHHERMDGKGYPRGVFAGELSVQARILAIADIFEALTASDRPYKTPMKAGEALEILRGFKTRGHIDPDIFDIFVRQQVHLRYAAQFLAPAQQG